MMNCNCSQVKQLGEQIERHEQKIIQLVKIIGKTNEKVIELQKQKREKVYRW